jgi:hypothetical protein
LDEHLPRATDAADRWLRLLPATNTPSSASLRLAVLDGQVVTVDGTTGRVTSSNS